jgi:hypothetical protein
MKSSSETVIPGENGPASRKSRSRHRPERVCSPDVLAGQCGRDPLYQGVRAKLAQQHEQSVFLSITCYAHAPLGNIENASA